MSQLPLLLLAQLDTTGQMTLVLFVLLTVPVVPLLGVVPLVPTLISEFPPPTNPKVVISLNPSNPMVPPLTLSPPPWEPVVILIVPIFQVRPSVVSNVLPDSVSKPMLALLAPPTVPLVLSPLLLVLVLVPSAVLVSTPTPHQSVPLAPPL